MIVQMDDNERKLLVEAKREAAASFDKTMTTLSAGALALSLTIVKDIAKTPAQWRGVLVAGWILFGSALIAIVFSFLFIQYAIDARIGSRTQTEKRWDKSGRLANWMSLIFFMLGIALLLIFTLKNFLR